MDPTHAELNRLLAEYYAARAAHAPLITQYDEAARALNEAGGRLLSAEAAVRAHVQTLLYPGAESNVVQFG